MKRCSKCGIEKDELGFHKRKKSKDGYDGWCKACKAKIGHEYHLRPEVKERKKIKDRKIRELPENKIKAAEYQKHWRATYKGALSRKNGQRKFYLLHKAEEKERIKKWRQTENGRKSNIKAAQKQNKRHPEGTVARNRINNAISRNKLKRQLCCVCGSPKAHGHHPSYDKPLNVIWLCALHHKQIHQNKDVMVFPKFMFEQIKGGQKTETEKMVSTV